MAKKTGATEGLKPITEIARNGGIPEEYLIPKGRFAAKVDSALLSDLAGSPDARLVVVTSMSPTPAGEGKTTLTIGLAQSLRLLGKKVAACIRQPSLGPMFGAKGGATGSGLSMVHPSEEISLIFTGDDCAVTLAHNLISSIIDNHIHHGNELGIDPERILWHRVSGLNDRALRRVTVGAGAGARAEEFHISAASEVMSILCLSTTITEVKARLEKALLAYTTDGRPVTVKDLKVAGAAAALVKDALNPNLVQSTEGVPVFVHGGPFGNISIGCNTLVSTALAMKISEYVLTEAGFATDLGAEKFFDIKCRAGGLKPSAAVVVATLKALRLHGGSADYEAPDIKAVEGGLDNLRKHIENVRTFGVPAVVVLNRYADDPAEEIAYVIDKLRGEGELAVVADVRDGGGELGIEAAELIIESCNEPSAFKPLYGLDASLTEKVSTIARDIYGASGVDYTDEAKKDLADIERLGLNGLPVCMAKTHFSLSDDKSLKGRPTGFRITVKGMKAAAGAGFIVVLLGKVLLMPGLPAHPLAEDIDVDPAGRITGL